MSEKPLEWIGSSKEDLKAMPEEIKKRYRYSKKGPRSYMCTIKKSSATFHRKD